MDWKTWQSEISLRNWCSPSLDNSEAFIILAKVIGPFPNLGLLSCSLISQNGVGIGSYLFSVRYQLHVWELMSSIPQERHCILGSWPRVEMQQYASYLLTFLLCIELILVSVQQLLHIIDGRTFGNVLDDYGWFKDHGSRIFVVCFHDAFVDQIHNFRC